MKSLGLEACLDEFLGQSCVSSASSHGFVAWQTDEVKTNSFGHGQCPPKKPTSHSPNFSQRHSPAKVKVRGLVMAIVIVQAAVLPESVIIIANFLREKHFEMDQWEAFTLLNSKACVDHFDCWSWP